MIFLNQTTLWALIQARCLLDFTDDAQKVTILGDWDNQHGPVRKLTARHGGFDGKILERMAGFWPSGPRFFMGILPVRRQTLIDTRWRTLGLDNNNNNNSNNHLYIEGTHPDIKTTIYLIVPTYFLNVGGYSNWCWRWKSQASRLLSDALPGFI